MTPPQVVCPELPLVRIPVPLVCFLPPLPFRIGTNQLHVHYQVCYHVYYQASRQVNAERCSLFFSFLFSTAHDSNGGLDLSL